MPADQVPICLCFHVVHSLSMFACISAMMAVVFVHHCQSISDGVLLLLPRSCTLNKLLFGSIRAYCGAHYYSLLFHVIVWKSKEKGYASQEILNVTVLFRLIFDWSMFRFMRDVSNLFHVNQANQMAIFREVIRVKRITIAIFIIYTN